MNWIKFYDLCQIVLVCWMRLVSWEVGFIVCYIFEIEGCNGIGQVVFVCLIWLLEFGVDFCEVFLDFWVFVFLYL